MYRDFLNWTTGIVFLGTPLRGTKAASIACYLVWLRKCLGKDTSDTLIKGLEEKERSLIIIIQDFAKAAISYTLQIWCFYKTLKTQVAKAVLKRKWMTNYTPQIEVRFLNLIFALF